MCLQIQLAGLTSVCKSDLAEGCRAFLLRSVLGSAHLWLEDSLLTWAAMLLSVWADYPDFGMDDYNVAEKTIGLRCRLQAEIYDDQPTLDVRKEKCLESVDYKVWWLARASTASCVPSEDYALVKKDRGVLRL